MDDLALASLPSLEESRIALWSARAVLSLYDIGPAEDVRVEVAANFDRYKPSDTGRCGEPFTAMVACNKTFALWLHGLSGFALAGEDRIVFDQDLAYVEEESAKHRRKAAVHDD